jgi:hypothetical protein
LIKNVIYVLSPAIRSARVWVFFVTWINAAEVGDGDDEGSIYPVILMSQHLEDILKNTNVEILNIYLKLGCCFFGHRHVFQLDVGTKK